jgi:hypothetical protein
MAGVKVDCISCLILQDLQGAPEWATWTEQQRVDTYSAALKKRGAPAFVQHDDYPYTARRDSMNTCLAQLAQHARRG